MRPTGRRPGAAPRRAGIPRVATWVLAALIAVGAGAASGQGPAPRPVNGYSPTWGGWVPDPADCSALSAPDRVAPGSGGVIVTPGHFVTDTARCRINVAVRINAVFMLAGPCEAAGAAFPGYLLMQQIGHPPVFRIAFLRQRLSFPTDASVTPDLSSVMAGRPVSGPCAIGVRSGP